MIILGIDPGTARCGLAVLKIDTGKPFLIAAEVINTSQDLDMQYRLKSIYKALHEAVNNYKPNTMVIERLFFNTNAKTAISVGQARGVVLLTAADKKLDVFEYTALEAKKVLTGYGRASKKEMQDAVQKHLNLEKLVKSDDANDAIAIALCHFYKYANESPIQ